MKRGFTKPFSGGRLGQEQREEASAIRSVNFHLKKGNFQRALHHLEKVTSGRQALRTFLHQRIAEQQRDEHAS